MGRELEVSRTGSRGGILRARGRPRSWGGGVREGRRRRKRAAPRRGGRERCHIHSPYHHHPVAVPKTWLMWPSTRDLAEGQPETRGCKTSPSGLCCPMRLKEESPLLPNVPSLQQIPERVTSTRKLRLRSQMLPPGVGPPGREGEGGPGGRRREPFAKEHDQLSL